MYYIYISIIEDNFLKNLKIESQKQIIGELKTYAQITAKGNTKLINATKYIRNPKSIWSSSSGRPFHAWEKEKDRHTLFISVSNFLHLSLPSDRARLKVSC